MNTPELCMEISSVRRNFSFQIIYLVIQDHIPVINILHGDLAFFSEWHWPVTIEGATRIHANSERTQRRVLIPSHAKKISYRNFDRRFCFAIPVNTENRIAPGSGWCHPDMLDRA